MRRLLIIGCGDVVRRALPQLLRQWRVYALMRHRDPELAALGVTQIAGDLDRIDTLSRLTGLAHAVLHSAPPPDQGSADSRTRHLLAVLRRGRSLPRCCVYISTTGVYGDCGGARIDETRKPAPRTARALRRVDAERRLREFGANSGCAVSILRAPGIYAADRLPLDRVRKSVPLLRTQDDVHTNHIHADDLASACVCALRRGRPNRIYNASDDSDLAMGDWFDALADAFHLPRAPRASRAEIEGQLPPLQLSFMRESRRLGNRRIKRELHLRLRYPTVHAGLDAALQREAG